MSHSYWLSVCWTMNLFLIDLYLFPCLIGQLNSYIFQSSAFVVIWLCVIISTNFSQKTVTSPQLRYMGFCFPIIFVAFLNELTCSLFEIKEFRGWVYGPHFNLFQLSSFTGRVYEMINFTFHQSLGLTFNRVKDGFVIMGVSICDSDSWCLPISVLCLLFLQGAC